jgi:arylsulfatase A-like enzyme
MPNALRRHSTLAFATLAAFALACTAHTPDPRRSVLVVVVDSLHAGHVSAHGYPRATTPNFDAFAAAGVRFEHAYSQSSWTLPSTASLFTGLEQERHGVRTFDDRLPSAIPTLAERFLAAGYRTCAIVQTPVLSSRHGLDRGFERYTVLDHSTASVEKALALAEQTWTRDETRPLFLYLHLAPPHMPYQPPAPFAGRFGEEHAAVSGSIEDCRRVHRAKLAAEDLQVRALAARYDDHVAFADDGVGRLLESLARHAPRTNALVVWTSDHGEAFQQHGSQGHNATVYEEMIHVPLALRALDGTVAPRVAPEVVSTLDVAPTLLELCGAAPLPLPCAGRSFAPALRGESLAARTLYFSSRYKDDEAQLHAALRRGKWKLLAFGASERAALHDLEADPHELTDLSAERSELAKELGEELRRWRAELAPAERAPERSPAREASARARLGELGYADGADSRR